MGRLLHEAAGRRNGWDVAPVQSGEPQRPAGSRSAPRYIYAVTGRHTEAREELARLTLLARDRRVFPWRSAIVHLGLGEHDQALELIEQASRDRDWQVRLLPVEPFLDPLRPNSRSRALVEKVH